MKKIFLLLTMGVLMGHTVMSQTELYKQMCRVEGIKASCIENCPIGNGVTVNVTMLETEDTTSYREIIGALREKVGSQDSALRRTFLRYLTSLQTMDMTMEVSPLAIENKLSHAKALTISLMMGRKLTEEKGWDVVYGVAEMKTVLVFHYKDEEELNQVITYVLRLMKEGAEALKE